MLMDTRKEHLKVVLIRKKLIRITLKCSMNGENHTSAKKESFTQRLQQLQEK